MSSAFHIKETLESLRHNLESNKPSNKEFAQEYHKAIQIYKSLLIADKVSQIDKADETDVPKVLNAAVAAALETQANVLTDEIDRDTRLFVFNTMCSMNAMLIAVMLSEGEGSKDDE